MVFGRHTLPADDVFHPYVRPQETGQRTGVHWLRLLRDDGQGIEFRAVGAPAAFGLLPFTQEALAAAAHDHELERTEQLTLHLTGKQMGVGGDNSWGARPHPEYRLPARGSYTVRWQLRAAR
jgi:beta-galactosidase